MTAASAISRRSFAFINQALRDNKLHAAQLIAGADARRTLRERYAAAFESMNTREKSALTSSYRIFGRVIARQSLLQLSADLDALRLTTGSFQASDSTDETDLAALLSSETAVQKDLDNNQSSLKRAQGDAWNFAMRSDFANLLALRQDLVRANARFRDDVDELGAGVSAAVQSLPAKLQAAAPRVLATPPSPAAATDLAAEGWMKPVDAAPAPSFKVHSVEHEDPRAHEKRREIAWISAVVVALLSYIAIGTIFSIVQPVRRLLHATAQLAKGENHVTVQRGGIKELDTLTVAFNAMAQELSTARSAARDYQQRLETTVEQRTHQLQELAELDPLTDLPNRRELFVLLNAAIERAHADGGRAAVFFLDIDNFKYINDSLGHAFGDRVLVALAQRLQVTTENFGFAARLGGDEFTVVLEQASGATAVAAAGAAIVAAFQAPLTVDGRDLIVSVSVGASVFPDHGNSAEALLKAADAALFRAKAMGRSQLCVFTPELLEAAAAKFSTEQGLRRAVERREFELLFQPEVCADTLQTVLVEALIRWRLPDGTLARPGTFLGIAEESGLIMDISDWVLEAAIEAAAQWHHDAWPNVRVAINVSPRQLIDVKFFDRLYQLLDDYLLPPRCLEIELTESVLQTGPRTIAALKRLRAHGVALALDDFGTGYSSLASVEQLPLTRIKLDRSLIASIDTSARSATIAHAIIVMCQGLGLEITAEGVERAAQLAILQQHRGMTVQGYLLAHPTPRFELLDAVAKIARLGHNQPVNTLESETSNVVDLRQSRTRS